MAKPPVSSQNTTTSDHLQTWILRVYIHCEGCKKKVFKVLQSIDGVYKTVIDAKEHKATVTGSVTGEFLVHKLLKSGKHAEILPESFSATAADDASGNSKKKKKHSNRQNDSVSTGNNAQHVNGKDGSKDATTDGSDGGNDQKEADPAVSGAGGDVNGNVNGSGVGKKRKKKNKKRKSEQNDSNGPPNGVTEGLTTSNPPAATGVTAENVTASMEKINLGPPITQTVYSTPYELPPYQSYYPTPAYGVSYSTSYPSTESSYYTPPVYGYAQSHPSVFYPQPAPSSNYLRSAFDDNDDEGGEGRWCTIM